MPAQPDQCIVLRQWDYSETSQTVSLFGRELGVIRGLAKGARRPKAAYSGGFEVLTLGQAMLIPRPTGELAVVTEWDLQEVFWGPRRSLAAHYAGFYMVDLVHHMVSDHDPHPALWDELTLALRALATPDGWARPVLDLQWSLLCETGYRPALEPPPDARHPARGGPRAFGFDPIRGGLVSDPGATSHTVWRVRGETVELLRGLGSGVPPSPSDGPACHRAARLLSLYLRSIIGRELASREALFQRKGETPLG